MPVYTNAADVLPPDLLTEVQKRWQGLLYVPPPERRNKAADPREAVLLAIQSGCPVKDIAVAYGMSSRHVYRLGQRLGRLNPYADQTRRVGGRPRHKAPVNVTEANDGTFRQSPSDAQKAP